MEQLLRTSGESSLYLRLKFFISTSPFIGHFSSWCLGWSNCSCGTSRSLQHLLMETIYVSILPTLWMNLVIRSPIVMIFYNAIDKTIALDMVRLWTMRITVEIITKIDECFIYVEYQTNVPCNTCSARTFLLLFSWSFSITYSFESNALMVELPFMHSE